MSTFANLKKNSKSNIDKLTKLAEKIGSNNKPDRSDYWNLTRDAAGNGFAIIRFLPAPPQDGEDGTPWVKYYDYGFQNKQNNQWYIEKARSTLGETDFIGEYNSTLWNTGIKENIDRARAQGRRTRYVSNIYVVKDSKNPETEGKVFKFEYGSTIFAKLLAKIKPEFEDDVPTDIFDFWTGCNSKLTARKVDNQINYDLSEFESPSPLFDDDD